MTDPRTVSSLPGNPYLAVDVQPDQLDGTFVVDESSLDGEDLLGWSSDAQATWVNVVCDVTGVTIERGQTRLQGVQTKAEAGECVVTLLDTRRLFDPMINADAIHSNTPIRVRAWGYDISGATRWDRVLFTGVITDVPVVYPKVGPPQVTITATDVIGVLSQWAAPGRPEPGVGGGDTLLQRVQRVLTEVGMPSSRIATDVDSSYATTLAATTLASAWDVVTSAVDAELGRVWVNVSDQLVVRGRGSALSGTVRGTLSDVHGEVVGGTTVHCCYSDLTARLGRELLANRVIGARRVPQDGTDTTSALVQADDAYSQARWGIGKVDNRNLDLQTDAQLTPWAQWVILSQSRPELRVDNVRPFPSPVDVASARAAWPAVLATDVGDRWLVRYTPDLGPGIARGVGVIGVRMDLPCDAPWSVVWTTEAAPEPGSTNPMGWWTLDVSTLDGPDLLAPYGGTVAA